MKPGYAALTLAILVVGGAFINTSINARRDPVLEELKKLKGLEFKSKKQSILLSEGGNMPRAHSYLFTSGKAWFETSITEKYGQEQQTISTAMYNEDPSVFLENYFNATARKKNLTPYQLAKYHIEHPKERTTYLRDSFQKLKGIAMYIHDNHFKNGIESGFSPMMTLNEETALKELSSKRDTGHEQIKTFLQNMNEAVIRKLGLKLRPSIPLTDLEPNRISMRRRPVDSRPL